MGDYTHIGVLSPESKKVGGGGIGGAVTSTNQKEEGQKPEKIHNRSQSSVEVTEHKGLAVGTIPISRRHHSMKVRSLPTPHRFT